MVEASLRKEGKTWTKNGLGIVGRYCDNNTKYAESGIGIVMAGSELWELSSTLTTLLSKHKHHLMLCAVFVLSITVCVLYHCSTVQYVAVYESELFNSTNCQYAVEHHSVIRESLCMFCKLRYKERVQHTTEDS